MIAQTNTVVHSLRYLFFAGSNRYPHNRLGGPMLYLLGNVRTR